MSDKIQKLGIRKRALMLKLADANMNKAIVRESPSSIRKVSELFFPLTLIRIIYICYN